MVAEARSCESPSGKFKGTCSQDTNCATVCMTEGFSGGSCKGGGKKHNNGGGGEDVRFAELQVQGAMLSEHQLRNGLHVGGVLRRLLQRVPPPLHMH
nr:defensin-like protein P322 [Ipomoea batatas]GMD82792.1 defensin-like protein P322 [Ipomoea batatas]